MLPFLTFASGLVAGIVGIRMLKTVKTPESLRSASHAIGDKTRHGLEQAQTGLRDVAVSGLSAIEKTSANLRGKLTPQAVEAPPVAEVTPAVRKAASRKAKAAKTAPAEEEVKPVRKRATRKPKATPEAAAPEALAADAGETS